MAVTPRTNRLWHPTRGISFSPGPTQVDSPVQSPRTSTEKSIGYTEYHIAAKHSVTTQSEQAWVGSVIRNGESTMQESPIVVEQTDEMVSIIYEDNETEIVEQEVAPEVVKELNNHPPPAVMEYSMVDDLFYMAKNSPVGSPASYWSYEQYRRMAEDGSSHKVKVHYCRSKHTMERVIKEYFMNEKVLGFDLEWMVDPARRHGVKNNVSLIQLASPGRIGLFHVALFANSEDMVGPSYRKLMENPEVIKVGVNIKGDINRLRTFLNIESQGLVELSHLYRLVNCSRSGQYQNINKKLVPLATQVEDFLHLPLFKGQDVRSSDWSKSLNMDQVIYSASDAYAGLQLYATLEYHRKQLNPCPPTPHYAELNLPIPLPEGVEVVKRRTSRAANSASKTTDPAVATETPKNKKTKTRKTTQQTATPKAPERPQDSRVEVAEDQAKAHRAANPEGLATIAQLRAFFLWHHYDLPPTTITQLLRDPPLATSTVANYILNVVRREKLPVDLDRLREVASLIPSRPFYTRWRDIARVLDGKSGDDKDSGGSGDDGPTAPSPFSEDRGLEIHEEAYSEAGKGKQPESETFYPSIDKQSG